MLRYFFLHIFLWSVFVQAQTRYTPDPGIDILHYTFKIRLVDYSNRIEGKTTVRVQFKNEAKEFVLDLQNVQTDGRGMTVSSVTSGKGQHADFSHLNDKLHIRLNKTAKKGEIKKFTILYSGIPFDGLVIGPNMYGVRTFFGDNYPDRARCWLPCVDHPADKATIEWIVEAPSHYKVAGNGAFVERKMLNDSVALTRWKENVPLSTKIMVVAAADFAVDTVGMFKDTIPVESWVYPQNRGKGLKAFSVALPALTFLDSLIGPYPYEKAANVQSTTRYGGCENASVIFYSENSVFAAPKRTERLVVHEHVHQWFGNSVTECDWSQAWLSEGFATYITHVYIEKKYGKPEMDKGLILDRANVIRYLHYRPLPVIDTMLVTYPVVSDISRLLSTNTYEKGGWFLHMLRCETGDKGFFEGLRKYYRQYRNKSATTTDFKKIMEETTGKDLGQFFYQWLRQPEIPVLKGSWSYSSEKKLLTVIIGQEQNYIFHIPLRIGIRTENDFLKYNLRLNSRIQTLNIPLDKKPEKVILDPDTCLLYEGNAILTEK
ncbi:MAG: M1 family metallopeptidase [Chlorobi bacterium]|nr:M1 family metallopeptidase [Chlorobiota bacterium]